MLGESERGAIPEAGGGGAHARLEEPVDSERRNENPQAAYRRRWAKTWR